jgi:hypothetical protein
LGESPGCALPCWNNITPQETTIAHANRLISGAGYTNETSPTNIANGRFLYSPVINGAALDFTRCKVAIISENAAVIRIRLYDCPPMQLGDVLRYLGTPEGVIPDRFGLVFRAGQVIVYPQRVVCVRRFSPTMFVGVIEIRNEPLNTSLYPWRGFIMLTGYMPRSEIGLAC